MKPTFPIILVVSLSIVMFATTAPGSPTDAPAFKYRWQDTKNITTASRATGGKTSTAKSNTEVDNIASRFPAPPGFSRPTYPKIHFANWLRGLPLLPEGSEVMLYDGRPKASQHLHAAVIDIDVGRRDRQQCADAVMRLYGEYKCSIGKSQTVCFDRTSGKKMCYRDFKKLPFRKYLSYVFAYANTRSLHRQTKPVAPTGKLVPGMMFIEPADRTGYGHAVIIVDVVQNEDGVQRFLLAQSYMPAQSIHVLKNTAAPDQSPWFTLDAEAPFHTPEWSFAPTDLRKI